MKRPVRVLIPTGFGLNCEEETARAFQSSAAEIRAMLAEYQKLREWEDPRPGKRSGPANTSAPRQVR